MERIPDQYMKLPPDPTRVSQFVGYGCVLIALFTGSACSSDSQIPEIRTNAPLSAVDQPVDAPQSDIDLGSQQPKLSEVEVADVLPIQEILPTDELNKLQSQLNSADELAKKQLEELLGLYRRLHIELDDSGRSGLIVDLFNDPRLAVRLLGFELVDRDLSGSTVIDPSVGDSARVMLGDEHAVIRAKAASLVTRLVLPDAMLVLTESLRKETDPIAAEPMLIGVARWPSPEAAPLVLEWVNREDSPFGAVCNAAWSFEEAGLWDANKQHPVLIERLRVADPALLNESGMKLIARIGDASDLQILLSLLLAENLNQQQWAANALVETPRAVELLVQAAERNSELFVAAADSLIRHRATPEGLRRLASLPSPNKEVRLDALVRMGAALENDRLTEAVRLAGLDSTQSALLLNRLLNGNGEITPRVAKGIILLAEIELENERPNRAFEAAVALDGIVLDNGDRTKIDTIKAVSLILVGKVDEAGAINRDPELWFATLQRTTEGELRKRIGEFMLDSFLESLPDERIKEIRTLAGIEEPAPEPVEQPEDASETPGDSVANDDD